MRSNLFTLSVTVIFAIMVGCSNSVPVAPLKTYFDNCDILKYNLQGHDFYDIVKVWGKPTDSLYAGKKLPKHKGLNGSWYYVAYSWADTSNVKVEGKLNIKVIFEAELDSVGVYKPIKDNAGIRPDCECYPLQ